MLAAFSVSPLGAGESVSAAVADAIEAVARSGLPYRTDAMFTTVEGEWDEVFAAVRAATDAVGRHAGRVSLVLKADIRPGHTGELAGKVARLRAVLQERGEGELLPAAGQDAGSPGRRGSGAGDADMAQS